MEQKIIQAKSREVATLWLDCSSSGLLGDGDFPAVVGDQRKIQSSLRVSALTCHIPMHAKLSTGESEAMGLPAAVLYLGVTDYRVLLVVYIFKAFRGP